ncbi:MAG TPA: iron ABC transporter permease, partial [Nitrospirales bacterium]|nr:iron ABC transporter permease [Nitrospirales bacterium]
GVAAAPSEHAIPVPRGAVLTRARWATVLLGLSALAVVTLAASLLLGAVPIAPGRLLMILAELMRHGHGAVDAVGSDAAIVLYLRVPRVLTGFLVGASLGTVGAVLQALVRNPLADPYILGISSGAALGACVAVLFGVSVAGLGLSVLPLCAFAGALLSIFIVYRIAAAGGGGRLPVQTLLLAGVILNAIFSALIMFATSLMTPARSFGMLAWLMGTLTGPDLIGLLLLTAYVGVGVTVLFRQASALNVLSLGEEAARTLGVNVDRVKLILFITAALLTGAVVSVSGIIGFVGMAIPHIVRLLFGPDHRLLLPASALVGGSLLVIADGIARTALAPSEFPVGVVTALLGGPFFVYLLVTRKRGAMQVAA